MQKRSKPDGVPAPAPVIVAGHRQTLSPAQQRFNQLVEQINRQRQELAEWKAFADSYHALLAEEYRPALARLRKKQVAMALLLDRLLEGKAVLEKRERLRARQMLLDVLSQVLIEAQEPDLVSLHDKHAPRSFEESQQNERDVVRALASEEFGVEIDAVPGAGSPDELAEWIDAQLHARSEQPDPAPPRRKSAKAKAREAERARAAEGGTKAVRELFRKLASELHPDRETDPAEQARKTELMQRVNQAYKAGNLLALLELQLSVEQIDLSGLAALAEERLGHYLFVLEEQLGRLAEERAALVAPFALAIPGASAKRLTTALVRQALRTDIRQIESQARALQQELELFRDPWVFKQALRDYPMNRGEEQDHEPSPPRRRRRRA